MKVEVCRCGVLIVWANNTKGHFVAFEIAEVETGNRFVLSQDAKPVAYSTVIGLGRLKHECAKETNPEEQGSFEI